MSGWQVEGGGPQTQLLQAMVKPILERRFQVFGAVGDLLEIAGDSKHDVEVVARDGQQVGKQLKVADVVYDEARPKDVHHALIHGSRLRRVPRSRSAAFWG